MAVDFQNLLGPGNRRTRISWLKRYFRRAIAEDPAFAIKTPAGDDLSCGITTVEIVGADVRQVARGLFDAHRIDCRPMTSHTLNGLRISLSVFNTEDQVDLLVAALREVAETISA